MPTQKELDNTKRQCIDIFAELIDVKNELKETIDELNSVSTELIHTKSELSKSKAQVVRFNILIQQLATRQTKFCYIIFPFILQYYNEYEE